MVMENIEEAFQNQILELRRGSIVIAIVGSLANKKLYGYSLLQELKAADIPVDGGTLYPLLRRLEKQGVLESSWEVTEGRPRKYYSLTADGAQLYKKLAEEWHSLNEKINHILKEDSWN